MNISFRATEEIANFLRKGASTHPNFTRMLSNQTLYRQKAQFLASDVLKANYKYHLGKVLEKTPFSISADEFTDLSGYHYLAICVHYWGVQNIENKLWSLVQLTNNLNAVSIYRILEEEIINQYGKFLIGFVTDGASVFKGHLKGVQKLINDKVSGLIGIHCLAHCTDLVAKKSFSQLEINIDCFLKNISNYFSASTKNKSDFLKFQRDLGLQPMRVLKICQTRWLEL